MKLVVNEKENIWNGSLNGRKAIQLEIQNDQNKENGTKLVVIQEFKSVLKK